MADSEKQNNLTSSSSSSSFFSCFTSKGVFQETESMMMSPTSILDSKPFSSNNKKKRCCYSEKLDSKGVGLALLDEVPSKQTAEARMVVFGSQLKIQIPPLPAEEGERVFKGCVSATELELMELSEDYTRVICHGPNPRTTHIFGNCIIQSTPSVDASTLYPSHSFLTACFLCNKNLAHGKDIYMYRGERAFCSNECRYQGMLMEEEMNKLDAEERVYGT